MCFSLKRNLQFASHFAGFEKAGEVKILRFIWFFKGQIRHDKSWVKDRKMRGSKERLSCLDSWRLDWATLIFHLSTALTAFTLFFRRNWLQSRTLIAVWQNVLLVSLHYPAGMRVTGNAYWEYVANDKFNGRSMAATGRPVKAGIFTSISALALDPGRNLVIWLQSMKR